MFLNLRTIALVGLLRTRSSTMVATAMRATTKGVSGDEEEGAASASASAAVATATVTPTASAGVLPEEEGVSSCPKTGSGLPDPPLKSQADPSNNHNAATGTMRVLEWGRPRELVMTNFTFPGDTTKAANSTGNPNADCDDYPFCINGCKSLFYKVTGGNGSNVTASTCGTATFNQWLFVWKGNGTCDSFTCVTSTVTGCSDYASATTTWTTREGDEYYVQVVGDFPGGGSYALSVSSDDPIDASKADVCGTSHPPPTDAPTYAPTDAPTGAPTDAPTDAPTEVPTATPSEGPTNAPTEAPTPVPDRCAGVGPTYWLHDPTTNAPVRKLINNSATCLLHPYNLEVRPCNAAAVAANRVRVRLIDATGGPPIVVYKSKPQRSSPYFLFGPAPTKGDVLPSPKALPNGVYYLAVKGAPEWGRLQFTQKCPCPDGTKKGKKGCMK